MKRERTILKTCAECEKEYFIPNQWSIKRRINSRYCSKHCSNKHSPSKFVKGHISWNTGINIQINTGKTHFKKGQTSREKNINWKGGIYLTNAQIRNSPDYLEWRRKILDRDDYTCQECGIRGGKLEADHIKPFALYPELRFELSNGRVLCSYCHRRTDTYGNCGKDAKKRLAKIKDYQLF